MPTLHIVIPVYNEHETFDTCLDRIFAAPLPEGWCGHITIIDDASTPAVCTPSPSPTARCSAEEDHQLRLIRHPENRGKGAALLTGFDAILSDTEHVSDDDIVLIQDADLEYDPSDYLNILEPIVVGKTRVVFGTRFGTHRQTPRLRGRLHTMGNSILTLLCNIRSGYRIHDMECCYKAFQIGVLRSIRPHLAEQRFGIEPEITIALSSIKEAIVEIPISYRPRGFGSGKKIKWSDGLRAIWIIMRPKPRDSSHSH